MKRLGLYHGRMRLEANAMKFALLLLASAAAFTQELPDAPQPLALAGWREISPALPVRHVRTFSLRRATDPPLRSNRETLRSAGFWAPQIATGIAGAADVYVNRHNPKASQEIGIDTGVPLATGFVLSYLADRYLWRPIGWGFAAYGIALHTRGAATGKYP